MRGRGFLERLGLVHPVVQAPMAGGITTAELVAAVSGAGGLGSIGAAGLDGAGIVDAVARARTHGARVVAVNLFAGGREEGAAERADASAMLALLAEVHAELDLPPPVRPALAPDPLPAQLAAVLEARPEVLSFTFGMPSAEALAALRRAGITTIGTATTVEEGRLLEAAGVDAVTAQGAPAGGHRGSFAVPFAEGLLPTLDLVAGLAAAVRVPILAAGGLMDGRDLRAALASGADAAQLGTAFLACPEAGTHPAHRGALLLASDGQTVLTRAFTGRPARGLPNAFTTLVDAHEPAILPYPLQARLTAAMRATAAERGLAAYLALWSGAGVARLRVLPAAELVTTLAEEANRL
jgi:nitronate monooxygenase